MPKESKVKSKTKGELRRSLRLSQKPYQMTDVVEPGVEEFASTGRTGRRNALGDILNPQHAKTSTAGLPIDMDKIKLNSDGGDDGESNKSDTASKPEDKSSKDTNSRKDSKS